MLFQGRDEVFQLCTVVFNSLAGFRHIFQPFITYRTFYFVSDRALAVHKCHPLVLVFKEVMRWLGKTCLQI